MDRHQKKPSVLSDFKSDDYRIFNDELKYIQQRRRFASLLTPNKPNPEDRLNGTLSATAIAVFNGAHIIRTHDIDNQLIEIVKLAEEVRRNK